MQNGLNNLEKANNKVDYIITHCAPTNVQALIGKGLYKKDYLTDYLQEISEKCDFKNGILGIIMIINKLTINMFYYMKM